MGSLEKELLFCDTFAHDEAEVSRHADALYRYSRLNTTCMGAFIQIERTLTASHLDGFPLFVCS